MRYQTCGGAVARGQKWDSSGGWAPNARKGYQRGERIKRRARGGLAQEAGILGSGVHQIKEADNQSLQCEEAKGAEAWNTVRSTSDMT